MLAGLAGAVGIATAAATATPALAAPPRVPAPTGGTMSGAVPAAPPATGTHLAIGTPASLTGPAGGSLTGSAANRSTAIRSTATRSTAAGTNAAGNNYVGSMATAPTPLPPWAAGAKAPAKAGPSTGGSASNGALPGNYGLTSSLQSFLNAGGVDAMGAYSQLGTRYGQLPGTGEIITNVSVGDLTDQSMADAGDGYVRTNGPTTVVVGGQRYLDLPSMPLIPTYVAGSDGSLDPTGSTEGQDSSLGEVMLDFGVMAPLPHDRQRAGETGSGVTDLLGIAPGAQYRLVVPQQATIDQIGTALVAAANQNPRPDVITASLGFGTDTAGFPGRYLEDDPALQSIIAGIVAHRHIVVCVSANDGTRLYTPAAIGPDGGATATDLTRDPAARTTIDDDAYSTTPSEVLDSGAIAAGGTTLDDTLATPASSRSGTVVETRISGAGNFASGFGTRVNLSAPSDGIVTFQHTAGGAADAVTPVLSGGTSASAPEIAAAAAVVLQAARLTHRAMSPTDVRDLLEKTGRAVPTPAAIDRTLQVGPQIDLSRAVASLLPPAPKPAVVRVSVAHRVTIGLLGGQFLENTDPGVLDLAGPDGTGEGLTGPVTFGLDTVGLPASGPLDYVLRVGSTEFHASQPSIRVLPADLLAATGLPVVATADRTVNYTLQVRRGGTVLVSTDRSVVVGPTDGTYTEASAPAAPATAKVGAPVTVHYDLTGVRDLTAPQIAVSTVGHWSPATAPLFSEGYTVDLTATKGTVTIPASAFRGGAGLYGIGIVQNSQALQPLYGEFTPIRLAGDGSARPAAPTLSTGTGRQATRYGHLATVTRAASAFNLRYDVRGVPGATGAVLEVSAPAPTVYGSLNTFTNANGNTRDNDGVNAGSVLYLPLAGKSGTLHRDALTLGIATSMSYDVRILATDRHGAVVGQASPSSELVIDDGLVPDDGTVDSFGIAGTDSVAAVHDGDGASVLRYAPSTGRYGAALAHDADPDSRYEVFGVDAGTHRALVMRWSYASTDQRLLTYDTSTGRLVASVSVPGSQYQVLGGRVDPARHRAAVLARHQPDNADSVLPVSLADGTLGTAIPADAPGIQAGWYSGIDIDSRTGVVELAHLGGSLICIGSTPGAVAAVNLDTAAVTASSGVPGCAYGFASDGQGGKVYQLTYRSFSVNILGTTSLVPVDAGTLTAGTPMAVRTQVGLGVAVDGTHQLALVAFPTPTPKAVFGVPGGLLTDSNSTSQLAVVDLATGTTIRVLTGLNLTSGFGGPYDADTERSIQLDPATRTGWTYGPGDTQIQQFSY
ncbi:hypothetical protein Raf01_90550 [Rugosimonospora africana]|uniref:Peptidase S8/S53 domain-containing protein n=1 Tax=Rugosimonospora africana TaxID=556532 RepID=A0A8J3R1Q6_9ACTN|nr:hypothetical protein Raf01_90550 [Rugosimonospora africana]